MPITTKHGNIFDSTAQVLVCPVNCDVEVWIHECTEGWRLNGDILEKYIHSAIRWWTISDSPPPFTLRLNRMYIATRPTLRECQILAHATARLWAGEK